MNRTLQIALGVVILVIVAGASFYGGMLFGERQAQTTRAGRFTGAPGGGFNNGQGGGFNNGQGRGGVFGQITEVGSNYITVTENNGTQTKVMVTDTTLIEKNASVKLTDLASGDTVIVSGSQGSDGSYTARSVQVAPAGRIGNPGSGGPNGGGTNGGPGFGPNGGPPNNANP